MIKKNYNLYLIVYSLFMLFIIGGNQIFSNGMIIYIFEIINIIFMAFSLAKNNQKIDKDTYAFLKKFILLYVLVFIYSAIILILGNEYKLQNLTRALSTTIYGILAIINGVFSYKLFGKESIKYIFYICVIIYTLAIIQYIGKVGLKGFINYYLYSDKLGNELEIHGLGYIFGLYFIYFIFLDKYDKRNSLISLIYCVLVWKRIVLLTIAIVTLIYILFYFRKRKQYKGIFCLGVAMVLIFNIYIYSIKNGTMEEIANKYNINFMSRLSFYDYFYDRYEYNIFYFGHYLGYTDKVMQQSDVIKALDLGSSTSLHNDILRYYIDLGFFMSLIWFTFFLIKIPKYVWKKYGYIASIKVFAIILYYFINQMVCNIARSNAFNIIYICMILVICNECSKKRESINKK